MSQSFSINFDFSDLGDSFAPIAARLPAFIGDDRNDLVFRCYENLDSLASADSDFATIRSSFSPIVLFGPGYCGKSCLSVAFARRLVKLFSKDLRSTEIIRIGLGDFCRDFGKAVHAQAVDDFLSLFDVPGVVLFDDLQKMAGNLRASIQLEKLLVQFEKMGQLAIFTSRQSPGSIPQLSDRLASRLSAGLVMPVNFPGPTGKKQIIELLRDQFQHELSPQTVDSICAMNNISFADITQYFSNAKVAVPSPTANESLQTNGLIQKRLNNDSRYPDRKNQADLIDRILLLVSQYYQISIEQLTGPSRQKKNSLARNVSIFLIRNKTNLSYQKIGLRLGGRDHSTIMHAYQKISASQNDHDIRAAIEFADDHLFQNQPTI